MRQVLLLRGVNVGGVKLSMADLVLALSAAGAGDIRTYIQSGNAVFDGPLDQGALAAALRAKTGLAPDHFLYDAADFAAIAAASPFDLAGGKTVHVFFLARPSAPDLAVMGALAREESFALTPRALYLSAPNGIGRSVLVERLPRLMGVPMTARNGNTVAALLALLGRPVPVPAAPQARP